MALIKNLTIEERLLFILVHIIFQLAQQQNQDGSENFPFSSSVRIFILDVRVIFFLTPFYTGFECNTLIFLICISRDFVYIVPARTQYIVRNAVILI